MNLSHCCIFGNFKGTKIVKNAISWSKNVKYLDIPSLHVYSIWYIHWNMLTPFTFMNLWDNLIWLLCFWCSDYDLFCLTLWLCCFCLTIWLCCFCQTIWLCCFGFRLLGWCSASVMQYWVWPCWHGGTVLEVSIPHPHSLMIHMTFYKNLSSSSTQAKVHYYPN